MGGAADEFDVGGAPVPGDRLDKLTETLTEAVDLEEAVAQMEADLKAAKASLNTLKSSRIPEMMAEIGMETATVRGWSIKIQDFVSGSLPKDDTARERALDWLIRNGAEGIIKTDVGISFGKNQYDDAIAMAREIEGKGYAPNVSTGVHAQTLQAFARERLKNGEAIDTDLLGLYTGRVAKFGKAK